MNLCGFYKYIAILAVLSPLLANAQEDEEELMALPDSMYAVRQAVKFDPLQMFFGDYQFYFEQYMGRQWSVEVGLGPTRRNFTASIFEYELDNFGSNVDIKTRIAASLWAKRYFWDTGELYGLYMGAALTYRRNDKTYNVINADGILSGVSFDDSRRYSSLLLVAGYQALPLQSNIFCDFYLGAGVRYRDAQVVRSTGINDPALYEVRSQYSWVGALQLGVKIGYGF